MSTAAAPRKIGKVSDATVRAARAFCESLRDDFDSPPGGDIVAAWTSSGLLLVACRGRKAVTLAHLLRKHRLADPDHEPDRRETPPA